MTGRTHRLVLVAVALAGCESGGAGATGPADAGGDAGVAAWATWPMPNTTAGLPNPASFDTSRDDVAVDRVTGLMWQRALVDKPLPFDGARQACAALTLIGFVRAHRRIGRERDGPA